MSNPEADERRRRFKARLELHKRRHEITLDVTRREHVEWDALAVDLVFARPPNADELRQLEEFVIGWHRVGVYGGFEGIVHDAELEQPQLDSPEPTLRIILDLGSAPQLALDVFLRGLRGLKVSAVPIDSVVLGWGEDESRMRESCCSYGASPSRRESKALDVKIPYLDWMV